MAVTRNCIPPITFGGDRTTLTPSRAGVAAEDVTDGTRCRPVHPPPVCPLVTPSKDGVAVAASSGEKIPDIPRRGREGVRGKYDGKEGWTKGQRKGG